MSTFDKMTEAIEKRVMDKVQPDRETKANTDTKGYEAQGTGDGSDENLVADTKDLDHGNDSKSDKNSDSNGEGTDQDSSLADGKEAKDVDASAEQSGSESGIQAVVGGGHDTSNGETPQELFEGQDAIQKDVDKFKSKVQKAAVAGQIAYGGAKFLFLLKLLQFLKTLLMSLVQMAQTVASAVLAWFVNLITGLVSFLSNIVAAVSSALAIPTVAAAVVVATPVVGTAVATGVAVGGMVTNQAALNSATAMADENADPCAVGADLKRVHIEDVNADEITNAKKVWSFLKTKGLSSDQAAGVMGNFRHESGMDATCVEAGFKYFDGHTIIRFSPHGDYTMKMMHGPLDWVWEVAFIKNEWYNDRGELECEWVFEMGYDNLYDNCGFATLAPEHPGSESGGMSPAEEIIRQGMTNAWKIPELGAYPEYEEIVGSLEELGEHIGGGYECYGRYVEEWAIAKLAELTCYDDPFTIKVSVRMYYFDTDTEGWDYWSWYHLICTDYPPRGNGLNVPAYHTGFRAADQPEAPPDEVWMPTADVELTQESLLPGLDAHFCGGIGLGQWTGPRGRRLIAYSYELTKRLREEGSIAEDELICWWDIFTQLSYADDDKRGDVNHSKTFDRFPQVQETNHEQGARTAARWFCENWEGISRAIAARENHAVNYLRYTYDGAGWAVDEGFGHSVLSAAKAGMYTVADNEITALKRDCRAVASYVDNSTAAKAMASYSYPNQDLARGNHGRQIYQVVHDGVWPGDSWYQSCDRGVSCALKWSGTDIDFPNGTWWQREHLNTSPKWQIVQNYTGRLEELQAGDVFMNRGHIWMYVSLEVAREVFPDTNKPFADASIGGDGRGNIAQGPGTGSRSPALQNDCAYYRGTGDGNTLGGVTVYRCVAPDRDDRYKHLGAGLAGDGYAAGH